MEADIICISSGDEDESQKENKQTGCPKNAKVTTQLKEEVIYMDVEEKESNNLKRKVSESESTLNKNPEKKVKLLPNKEVEDVTESANSRTLQTPEHKDNVKPKLVVKEKKRVCIETEDPFPMFISLCLQKERNDKESMSKIVDKLRQRYEQLDPTYAKSKEFKDLINEKRNAIMQSSNKVYSHIYDVMYALKKKRRKKSTLPTKTASVNNCVSEEHELSSKGSWSEVNEGNEEDVDQEVEDTETIRKINILVRTMRKCQKRIKKLEEIEVDFSDEDNSKYIQLERYKERFVQIYNKYCELSAENADAGRPYLRPKHISATGIVILDQAIMSFINAKISKRNKMKRNRQAFTEGLIFPDYHDILRCVKRCNETHNLGLENKKQAQIAKKAFIELGEHLQRVRRNDYWDTFSWFLENQPEDPATKNKELAEKLSRNRQVGEQKLARVFEEFVEKQKQMKDKPADENATDAEEDDESSIENGEEEDEEEEDEAASEELENLSSDVEDEDKKENRVSERVENVEETVRATDGTSKQEKQDVIANGKVSNDDEVSITAEVIPTSKEDKAAEVLGTIEETVEVIEYTQKGTESVFANKKLENSKTDKVNSEISKNKAEETEKACVPDTSLRTKIPEVEEVIMDIENEKQKPLVRVRSFAKAPTSWQDSQRRVECTAGDAAGKSRKGAAAEDANNVIDLTKGSKPIGYQIQSTLPCKNPLAQQQKGNTYKLWVVRSPLTPGPSCINLKNVKQNFVKLNTQTNSEPNVSIGQIRSTNATNNGNAVVLRTPQNAKSSLTNVRNAPNARSPFLTKPATNSVSPKFVSLSADAKVVGKKAV